MKYMCLFLASILLFGSVALKNFEKTPVYETPEIVKSNQLTGSRHTAFSINSAKMKALKAAQGNAGAKQGLRNNLIRGFSLDKLEKWVNHVNKENVNAISVTAERGNLNDIKTFSIEIQKYIHSSCARMVELLKILDLKLKEMKLINQKIQSVSNRKVTGKLSSKKLTVVKLRAIKLKKAMKKEKLLVKKVMKEIQKKQSKIVKILSVYDKKFAKKNQSKMQNLLTAINLKLKSDMKLAYFKIAYQNFISSVIASSKNLSEKELKNSQSTAQVLINKYWKGYLKKAKEQYEKNKKMSKRKGKKAAKKSSIKKIK